MKRTLAFSCGVILSCIRGFCQGKHLGLISEYTVRLFGRDHETAPGSIIVRSGSQFNDFLEEFICTPVVAVIDLESHLDFLNGSDTVFLKGRTEPVHILKRGLPGSDGGDKNRIAHETVHRNIACAERQGFVCLILRSFDAYHT